MAVGLRHARSLILLLLILAHPNPAAAFTVATQTARYHEHLIPGPGPDSPPPNAVDVFVRSSGCDLFFYTGKSCARAGTGGADGPKTSVVLQKNLILEQAKLQQPEALGRAELLEVWCAPLDGALAALDVPGDADALALADVGFLPEEDDAYCFLLDADGRFPLSSPWLVRV